MSSLRVQSFSVTVDGYGAGPRQESIRPWMELLRRTFAIDLMTCERCGGRTKIIALVQDPDGIARFLRHLGEPTEAPAFLPRARPYFPSRVLRRHPAEQGELFEA